MWLSGPVFWLGICFLFLGDENNFWGEETLFLFSITWFAELPTEVWWNFIWRKLHLVKLYFAKIDYANPFHGFCIFSNGRTDRQKDTHLLNNIVMFYVLSQEQFKGPKFANCYRIKSWWNAYTVRLYYYWYFLQQHKKCTLVIWTQIIACFIRFLPEGLVELIL